MSTHPFSNKHFGEITYHNNGQIKEMFFFEKLIYFENYKRKINIGKHTQVTDGDVLKVNIQGFLNLLKIEIESFLIQNDNEFEVSIYDEDYSVENKLIDLNSIDDSLINIIKEDFLEEGRGVDLRIDFDKWVLISFTYLYRELVKNSDDYLLYDILIDGENQTNLYRNEIVELQNKLFNEDKRESLHNTDLSHRFSYLNFIVKDDLENKLSDILSEKLIFKEIVVKENRLGSLIFNEEIYPSDKKYPHFKSFLLSLTSNLFHGLNNLAFSSYVPANRGSQQRVFHKDSYGYNLSNEFNKKLKYNPEENDNSEKFLIEVKDILNLKGELLVESFENVVAAIYLKSESRKHNLADYGFGYSQLIPIILQIYNTSYSNDSFLIIEEPEANLHPALQSKLADIFISARNNFNHLNLIIETHSEYFIRKLQFMVAKGELDTKDCIIHYFNSDENVTDSEPKVKPIEITEDGNLTDNFGPGFFDEITRLQFELMKIRKEQKN